MGKATRHPIGETSARQILLFDQIMERITKTVKSNLMTAPRRQGELPKGQPLQRLTGSDSSESEWKWSDKWYR